MKKLLIFLFIILLCSFVSADTLNIYRDSYQKGETLLAEVLTEETIDSSDVYLMFNGSKLTLGTSLTKVNDFYFLSIDLPTTYSAGNYMLHVNGLSKPFSIVDESASFSIRPAFALSRKGVSSYDVIIKNYLSETMEVIVDEVPNGVQAVRNKIEIEGLRTRSLKFYLTYDNLEEKSFIKISQGNTNYMIPVFKDIPETATVIIDDAVITVEDLPDKPLRIMKEKINPEFLNEEGFVFHQIKEGDVLGSELFVKNELKVPLSNVNIKSSGELGEVISFTNNSINLLNPGEEGKFEVIFNKDQSAEAKTYSGSIIITCNEKYTDSLVVWIQVGGEEPEEIVKDTAPKPVESKSETQPLINGSKLISEFETAEEEPSSSKNLILSLVLTAIVLIIIVLIYRTLKKKTTSKDFEEVVKKAKK